jgi:hypothetical protein
MASEPAPSRRRSLPNRTPDEALNGIEEINSRYLSHCVRSRNRGDIFWVRRGSDPTAHRRVSQAARKERLR